MEDGSHISEWQDTECSTSDAQRSPTIAGAMDLSLLADKAVVKLKRNKAQDPSTEFVAILSTKIEELEKYMISGSQNEREAAKLRKKQLREVQKYVSDRNNGIEDRIAFIQQKYTQQVADFMKLEKYCFDTQKELELVTKEKDKAQNELKKANAIRDKLQELCRSLQKEAHSAMEQARKRAEEDLKQRHLLQSKFTAAINDVTTKMDQQQQERTRQLAENDALREKLNDVLAQFENFNQLIHKKDLEVQLANAKFEQAQQINTQLISKVEVLQQANDQLNNAHQLITTEMDNCIAVRQQNALLVESNKDLKAQLQHYCDKFQDFQSTLTKSNEMFDSLKRELEAQHKAKQQMLREREELRRRLEASMASNVQLSEDKQAYVKQVEKLQVKLAREPVDMDEYLRMKAQTDRLASLCRALQAQLKAGQPGQRLLQQGQQQDQQAEQDQQGVQQQRQLEEQLGQQQEQGSSLEGLQHAAAAADRMTTTTAEANSEYAAADATNIAATAMAELDSSCTLSADMGTEASCSLSGSDAPGVVQSQLQRGPGSSEPALLPDLIQLPDTLD